MKFGTASPLIPVHRHTRSSGRYRLPSTLTLSSPLAPRSHCLDRVTAAGKRAGCRIRRAAGLDPRAGIKCLLRKMKNGPEAYRLEIQPDEIRILASGLQAGPTACTRWPISWNPAPRHSPAASLRTTRPLHGAAFTWTVPGVKFHPWRPSSR